MRASLAIAALVSAAFAAPHEPRQVGYYVINDGKHGSQTGDIDEFSSRSHSSAFFTHLGCSTTAKIQRCFTAVLPADSKASLETFDMKPWIAGGVGTNQRAFLLPEIYHGGSGVITHKVRFHISTTYTAVPVGSDKSATFVGLRNGNATYGLKAFDVKARQFTGEETSGTFLYVSVLEQNGSEDFPTSYPLAQAIGKTIEVTYQLGVNGATVDKDKIFVAAVSAKFVDGGQQLFYVGVTKTLHPNGIVDPVTHRMIVGADRKASAGQKELKVWFGDYSVTPAQPSRPE